jgi:hypothetical protein
VLRRAKRPRSGLVARSAARAKAAGPEPSCAGRPMRTLATFNSCVRSCGVRSGRGSLVIGELAPRPAIAGVCDRVRVLQGAGDGD